MQFQVIKRFHMTSTSLQSPSQDLNTTYALYVSFHGYVQTMRSSFTQIEQKPKNLNGCDTHHGEIHQQFLPSRFNYDVSGYGSSDI